MKKEIIGNATLYQGDCSVILPQLDTCDLLLTDPPYGIAEGKKAARRTKAARGDSRWQGRGCTDYDYGDWDNDKPPIWLFLLMATKATHQIIWGGNYFGLPGSSCWLVWDKENVSSDFADCELAWTNLKQAVRLKKYLWNGFQKAKPEERHHPTQKPAAIMEWCLSFAPDAQTVLDPFMGSGTTGVACHNTGKAFTGIEREPKYFNIACKRIEQAQKQMQLFKPANENRREVAEQKKLF